MPEGFWAVVLFGDGSIDECEVFAAVELEEGEAFELEEYDVFAAVKARPCQVGIDGHCPRPSSKPVYWSNVRIPKSTPFFHH